MQEMITVAQPPFRDIGVQEPMSIGYFGEIPEIERFQS